MSEALPPLISLSPSSTLGFNLVRHAQSKTILTVKNVSSSKVLFKVKTTQPSWYYVRPNQHILEAGQSEDVSILLIDSEVNRFLDNLGTKGEEKVDKHRFLVQSKIIEDSEYNRFIALPANQRADEISKLWDGSKDDRRNVKLKVNFSYPEGAGRDAVSNITSSPSSSSAADELRNKLARQTNDASGTSSGSGASAAKPVPSAEDKERVDGGSGISAPPGSAEAVLAELQGLRKRYDAVVEYTVHLTAERDAIIARLEATQKDLIKEKSKKKGSDTSVQAKDAKVQKDKGGFGLISVLLAALIFFLLGKYFAA